MVLHIGTTQDAASVDRLMAGLLASARKLFGMEVAFVSEFCDGQRVFRYVDAQEGVALVGVNGSDPVEDSYCQRVVDGRLPELIRDASQNAEAMTLPATQAVARSGLVLKAADSFCTAISDPFCAWASAATLSLCCRLVNDLVAEICTLCLRITATTMTMASTTRTDTKPSCRGLSDRAPMLMSYAGR